MGHSTKYTIFSAHGVRMTIERRNSSVVMSCLAFRAWGHPRSTFQLRRGLWRSDQPDQKAVKRERKSCNRSVSLLVKLYRSNIHVLLTVESPTAFHFRPNLSGLVSIDWTMAVRSVICRPVAISHARSCAHEIRRRPQSPHEQH